MKSVIIHGNPLFIDFFAFASKLVSMPLFVRDNITEIFDRAIYHSLLQRRMRRMTDNWRILYVGTLFFWDTLYDFLNYMNYINYNGKIYLFYTIENCKLFDLLNYIQ